jgi:hypothetical protein
VAQEIVYGAYADANPNALFLMRTIPSEEGRQGREGGAKDEEEGRQGGEGEAKDEEECKDSDGERRYFEPGRSVELQQLKHRIRGRFRAEQLHDYSYTPVDYTHAPMDQEARRARAAAQEAALHALTTKVLRFFKQRVEEQYPARGDAPYDLPSLERRPHEHFVAMRAEVVYGRAAIARQVMAYVASGEKRIMTITKGTMHAYIPPEDDCPPDAPQPMRTTVAPMCVAANVAFAVPVVQRMIMSFLAGAEEDEEDDALQRGNNPAYEPTSSSGSSASSREAEEGAAEEGALDGSGPMHVDEGDEGGAVLRGRRILVLAGEAGAGKSALIALCANTVRRLLPTCKLFYHFVGAAPGSTDLVRLLRRLWMELGVPQEEVGRDQDKLVQQTPSLLARAARERGGIVIFIDALNQLDEDAEQSRLSWLPPALPPGVHCVVSCIAGSDCHQLLCHSPEVRSPCAVEVGVNALDQGVAKDIVKHVLARYQRSIDNDRVEQLVAKRGARNPLWLVTACEELRVHPSVATVGARIESFAEGLLGLLQQVLARFEREHGEALVTAVLCFLECSRHGLLETELLALAADEQRYTYTPPDAPDDGTSGDGKMADKPTDKGTDEKGGVGRAMYAIMKRRLHSAAQSAVQQADGEGGGSSAGGSGEAKEAGQAKKEAKGEAKGEAKDEGYEYTRRLPAVRWAPVYHSLRPFLRPCGEPGEGRLDFYHRAVSKAVRLKYLVVEGIEEGMEEGMEEGDAKEGMSAVSALRSSLGSLGTTVGRAFRRDPSRSSSAPHGDTAATMASATRDAHRYAFWHGRLADYFERCRDAARRAEELPYHLEKVLDNNRLLRAILDWDTFSRLTETAGGIDLWRYCRQVGGYNNI